MKFSAPGTQISLYSFTALSCSIALSIGLVTSMLMPRFANAAGYTIVSCPSGWLCFNDYDTRYKTGGRVFGNNTYWKYISAGTGWNNRADQFMLKGTSYNACLYDGANYVNILTQLDKGQWYYGTDRSRLSNRVSSNRWTKRWDCPEG